MSSNNWMAALAALAIITSATPASAKVEISKAASTALATGSTFAWAPEPAVANEITANRLQAITEATLIGRGYRQVSDPEEADFLVSYTIGMMPMSDADISASGCDAPVCGAPPNAGLDTSIHTEGMIVLDLTECRTGRLVWRATSKKRVTSKDVSDKRLGALLSEMTKSLPSQ